MPDYFFREESDPDISCLADTIFGFSGPEYGGPRGCLDDLCTPKGNLNPDLGGIGVSRLQV